MYKISKEFSFAMGHRLSRHQGLCKNIHGHNYKVIVGIKSAVLNINGMVMDFTELKNIVNEYITIMDHALMLSLSDLAMAKKMTEILPDLKVVYIPYEPTAEYMSRDLYDRVASKLPESVHMDYVTIYETDTSKATYTEVSE